MAEIINSTAIRSIRSEKKYSFECDSDSTLGEVFDVLTEMRSFVVERIQQSSKDQDPKPPVEKSEVIDV